MGMGTSTGNDSTFENTVDKFSQIENDENRNVDEIQVNGITASEAATEKEFVDWFMQKMNKLSPEERKDRLGDSKKFDYAKAQNWIRNVLDDKAMNSEYRSFKRSKTSESETNEEEVKEDVVEEEVKETEVVESLSPTGGTEFEQLVGKFSQVEKDPDKNVDEGKDKLDSTPTQNVTPFEVVLESCQHALDEKEEVVKEEIVEEEVEEEVADEKCKEEVVKEETEVEEGLAAGSDNLIYIAKESLGEGWDVFKTREGSNSSISMFTLNTEEEALEAGQKIADAIGGEFRGKEDPRVDSRARYAEVSAEEENPVASEESTDVDQIDEWQNFMDKHGFTDDELDRFAVNMGFDNLSDMVDKVTPEILRERDPEKFNEVLSDFVGSTDESVEKEVTEDVVEEEVVPDAHLVTEEDDEPELEAEPEPEAELESEAEPEMPKVDFGPLEAEVEKLIGVPVKLTSEVRSGRHEKSYLIFSSGDLIEHAGIFKAALKEVFVQNFSGGEVDEDGVIWWTVVLDYNHRGGGHNAAEILRDVWYDTKNDKWTFRGLSEAVADVHIVAEEDEVKEDVVEESKWKLSTLSVSELKKALAAQNTLMGIGVHDTELIKELEDAIAKAKEAGVDEAAIDEKKLKDEE